jgi:hypothetical protein
LDFLGNLLHGVGSIAHGIAGFFGGGGGAHTVTTTTTQVVQQQRQSAPQQGGDAGTNPFGPGQSAPELNLFQGDSLLTPLKKAGQPQPPAQPPRVSRPPAPQQAAAEIGSQLGYGPHAIAAPSALAKANPVPNPIATAQQIGTQFGYGTKDATSPVPITSVPSKPANPIIGTLQALNEAPGLRKVATTLIGNDIAGEDLTNKNVTGQIGAVIENTDPQLGELMHPGSYAQGAADLVNGAVRLAKATPGALRKAGSAIKSAPEAIGQLFHGTEVAAQEATEVAPGVHSVNPTQAEDAATAAQNQAAQANEITPTNPELPQPGQAPAQEPGLPQSEPVATQPSPGTATPTPGAPSTSPQVLENTSSAETVAQTQNTVNPPISGDAIWRNGDTDQPVRVTGVAGEMGGRTYVNIEGSSTAIPLDEVTSAAGPGELHAPTPGTNPLNQPQPEPAPVQPGQTLGQEPAGGEVPAAPLTHDALVKQLGEQFKALKGQYSQRPALVLDDLKQRAAGLIANMTPENLLKTFATTGPDTMVHDPSSFALARAALDRFAQNADDPMAQQAVENILNAMEQYTSKSGQALRIVQEDFDSMPLPMKVRYIINKIDNAWKGRDGYMSLKDDPAKAAKVEEAITGYLTSSQAISERISALQGQLNEIADAAVRGEKLDVNTKQIAGAVQNAERELQANNGELVKFYQQQVPGADLGRKVNDFARTMMLGSFTGRLNDLMTTTNNILHLATQNVTQGLLAKAVNFVKPGAATDTLQGVKQFFTGTGQGIKTGAGEFKGNQYADDLVKSFRNNTGARTGLQKANGPVSRFIQSATEFATNASEGVKSQRIYQLAVKEGQQQGLSGDLLKQYAEARAAAPSKDMVARAEQLHKEINNLNENPWSRALNRVAASIDPQEGGVKGFIGGVARNQIMPFTSWLGGNMWNAVTDKNVVASSVKLIASAAKGDVDGVVKNLAATGNNAAHTYALGYLMTQAGLLTNQGPEGYNDDGVYLHIGGRYIPVAFTGFFAPSIILGNAAYHAVNETDGSGTDKLVAGVEKAFDSAFRAYSVTSALGADNNVARTANLMTQPGSNITGADAAATFGAGVVGQYIPAATGDVNAVLNNGIPGVPGSDALNPTHEKADTSPKKMNSDTGRLNKDYLGSAVAQVQNRIPGLSQMLPRKEGAAAPDLVDRTTKGERDSGESIAKAQETQEAGDRNKQDKAADIPDPQGKFPGSSFEAAVEARVQRGEYDKAISAWEQKLELDQKDKNIPESTNKKIEEDIKSLNVLKDGKYDPSVRDLYKNTSLTEWRDMGDPESDSYDPKSYQLLWQYDEDLAKAGVSRSSLDKGDHFYSPKKPGKGKSGSGRSAANRAADLIKSNTLGSTPELKKIDFGGLAPQKVEAVKALPLQQIKPSNLIKKRAISVGKA